MTFATALPTLSSSLLRRASVLVLVCGLAFGAAFHYLVIAPATRSFAATSLDQASSRVFDLLERDLRTAEALLSTGLEWGRSGLIRVGDRAGFIGLMAPLLATQPRIAGTLLADEDGRELFLLRDPDGWRSRSTTPESIGRRSEWQRWNTALEATGAEWHVSDYDPRSRPWFVGALALASDRGFHWTAPYRFYTARAPGLTVSGNWQDSDGRRHILAFDLLLSELGRQTHLLSIGSSGGAALLSASDEVLIAPHGTTPTLPETGAPGSTVSQAGSPFLASGHAAWIAAGRPAAQAFDFELAGERWLGLYRPVRLGEQVLWVCSYARAREFAPAALDDLAPFAVIIACVSVIAVALAVRFARRIADPLRELAAQSERIGNLQLEAGPSITGSWQEIERLARAQERMREHLLATKRQRDEAHDELERQVIERTAALAEKQTELSDQLLFVQILIDAVPNPIFYKGPDARFLGCNRAYEQAFDTTRGFLVGKTVLELPYLPTADRIAYQDEDVRTIENCATVRREVTLPFADGRVRDALYWVSGFRLSDGRPGGLLGVIVDISEQKAAERAAREAEERATLMLESSPIAVVINRPDGTPLFANSRACELAGVSHEAYLNRSVIGWFRLPQRAANLYTRLRDGHPVRDEEVELVDATGRQFYTLMSMAFIDIRGARAVISWSYDITARRTTELELRKLSQAVEQSPAMLVITNPRGVIEYANPRFCEVSGFAETQARGHLPELLDEAGRAFDFRTPIAQALEKGSVWRHECRLRGEGGRSIWVALSVSGLGDERGGIQQYVWVLEDIGLRREADRALREAKRLAEEAAEAKARFLANMSHEIRTPMNAVIGLSRLALDGATDARQRDYLGKIQAAGASLLALINDILDFSRIEAGRLSLESRPFELDEVLQTLVTFVGQRAQEKGLELVLDVAPELPTQLLGDALRLGQILTNLVGNAVKFTERGEVRLAIRPGARRDDRLCLQVAVSDTGIGMDEAQQGRLFSAFSQGDSSTTRRFGGSGLGLSIARRLIELMDGSISVDSRPGAGSVFRFNVWCGLAGAFPATPRRLPGVLEKLRVLVVDDHPSTREVLQRLLQAMPLRTDVADSGAEALAAVHAADGSDPYGLVLMDLRMPGMDGIEACSRLKRASGLSSPPLVVMISAYGDAQAQEQAVAVGADGFVSKPVTASSLLDAIMNVFGAAPVMASLPADALPGDALAGLAVLVVEDNLVNQDVARGLLERVGATVSIASNGREALMLLNGGQQRFDAVLMDLQMPEMDGFAAIRAIRADPRLNGLPVIAMTAHAMEDERRRCFAAGMNEHVPKPIDATLLVSVIRRLTGRTGAATATSQDDTAGLPTLPGINGASALRRMGGDRSGYLQLLDLFLRGHRHSGAAIRKAIETGDKADAQQQVHALRGAAANIGAAGLAESSRVLEQALREDQDTTSALAAFGTALDAVLGMLAERLPDEPGDLGTEGPLDAELLESALRRLETLLASADGDATREFRRIRPALVQRYGALSCGPLAEAVQNYDYDEALARLRALMSGSTAATRTGEQEKRE
ncbi:MAG: response regulator [Zoogloeaceae bacterium]|nr:response regulator [Zoogloeaceae bacterium]